VDKPRILLLRSLFSFLSTNLASPTSALALAEAEAALNSRCAAESRLLDRTRGTIGRFTDLAEGVQAYVNASLVAAAVERECDLRRNDLARVVDRKNDLQARVNAANKKKDREGAKELKRMLAAADDGTALAHVRAAKEKHKKSKELRAKLDKLGKRRLFKELREGRGARVAVITLEWAEGEKKEGTRWRSCAGELVEGVRERCREETKE